MDAKTFTDRSHAHRAAKRMIAAGSAPGTEYELQVTEPDGRLAIIWDIPALATTEAIETEITAAVENTQTPPAAPEPESKQEIQRAPAEHDLTGPGADLLVDKFAEAQDAIERDGGIEAARARVEAKVESARVRLAKKPAQRRPSRAAELDAAAATGVMPEKPVVTSAANQHCQKRLDRLAELAGAGDWPAIEAYEVKGSNTYARMVQQYRDRLLAAHAASPAAAA